jgi:hypothetical protein
MKKAGLVILAIGLIITLITGFSFVTKEKVVDLGELEISANKRHNLNWSPLVGVGVMAVGVVLVLLGPKKI